MTQTIPMTRRIVPITAPIISPILEDPFAAGFGVGDRVGVVSPGMSTSKVGAGVSVSNASTVAVTVGKGEAVTCAVIVGNGVEVATGVPESVSSSSGSSGGSVALGSVVPITSSDGSTAPANALSCFCKFAAIRGDWLTIMHTRKIPIIVRAIKRVLYDWSSRLLICFLS